MTEPTVVRHGACMCGQLQFEVSAPPILTMACHCRGCQRLSASAFSLSEMFPAEGVRVTQGEPVIGALHGPSHYLYCPHCLNWMFTRPAGLEAFINVRAMMLEDAASFAPFMETMTCEKLPWAVTSAVRSFETFPEPTAFPELFSAFKTQA